MPASNSCGNVRLQADTLKCSLHHVRPRKQSPSLSDHSNFQITVSGPLILLMFVAIAALSVAVVISIVVRRRVGSKGEVKTQALQQFHAWLQTDEAHRLGLNEDSEIAHKSETLGQTYGGFVYSCSLTLYLKNQDGNYVMVKTTPRGPYAKAISHESAKVALKSSYAPASENHRSPSGAA